MCHPSVTIRMRAAMLCAGSFWCMLDTQDSVSGHQSRGSSTEEQSFQGGSHSSNSAVKRLISTDGLPHNAAKILRAHLIHKVLLF